MPMTQTRRDHAENTRFAAAVAKTREIIEARIAGLTPDIPVRDFEIKNIEKVLEDVDLDAHKDYPGDNEDARYDRVQYYKDELLKRFAQSLRPRLSAVYHQYVAATIRGGQQARVYSVDESGCVEMIGA